MQTSTTEFIFSCTEVMLPTKLHQSHHFTTGMPHTAFIFDDQEPIQWLIDNDIEYKSEPSGEHKLRIVRMLTAEDAMAFKLRWL